MPEQGYFLSPPDKLIFDQMKRWWQDNDLQKRGTDHRLINLPFPEDNTLKVKITSIISSQGGRYNAKLVNDGVKTNASGDLATTDIGFLSSAENAIVWNLAEMGTTTHLVDLSDTRQIYRTGYILAWDSATGFPIIGINLTISTFPARITAVSGSFPTWSYTVQRVVSFNSAGTNAAKWVTDSTNITSVLNRAEFGGTATYTYGTGLSITNASTGSVNSTSCVYKAIGIGSVVDVLGLPNDSSTITYSFCCPNSAQ